MNQHLSPHERYQIQIGLAQGLPIKAIAAGLGRSPSTIYREIDLGSGGAGYEAKYAQQRKNLRAAKSRNAKVICAQTWLKVAHGISQEHSPEQVADCTHASHEAIYQYIYRDKHAGGYLWLHLRCQKRYRKRAGGQDRRGTIPNQRSIALRPLHIENRAQIGHWEADTIVGPHHGSAILSIVERKSGYTLLALLPDRSAASTYRAMVALLEPIAHKVKTITTDNGGEFAWHEKLDASLGCLSYFCRPYASCQRGTNENTNGLVRQYIPKQRNLHTVDQQELEMIMERLNHRPRKRLGFKTPHQVFVQSLKSFATRT
jgi:transposase, IS30 family